MALLSPRLPLLLLTASYALVPACSGGFGSGDGVVLSDADVDTDADSDGDADGDTDADQNGDGVPDEVEGLDTGGCDDYDGTPIAGAATYFYGMYWESGGEYAGMEQWIIYANPTLESYGYGDCVVQWQVEAIETGTGVCTDCDLGLEVDAILANGGTSCPQEMYEGDEEWSTTYAIKLHGDGTSTFYFASTGDEVGNGTWDSDAMSFLSDKQCDWF